MQSAIDSTVKFQDEIFRGKQNQYKMCTCMICVSRSSHYSMQLWGQKYELCTISILFVSINRLVAIPNSTSNNDQITLRKLCTIAISLSRPQILQLRSLRSEIFQFVATYSRPENMVTGRNIKYRKSKKKVKERPPTVKRYPTKRIYKLKMTYPLPSERRHAVYTHFLNIFSMYNETMKNRLISPGVIPKSENACYLEVFHLFITRCDFHYFSQGGMRKMKALIARVCMAEWLTTYRITRVFKDCCQNGRFSFKKFTWRALPSLIPDSHTPTMQPLRDESIN